MANTDLVDAIFDLPYRLPGDGLVIDFMIALVFFTALSFAILHRRFEHKRSAAVMSAALGTSLAIGLMAWELRSGLRLSNLGPIAAGLGLVMIAMVIYQAIRRVGGNVAGGATALGATLLIGQVLAIPWLQQLFHGILGPLIAIGLLAAGTIKLMMYTQHKGRSTWANPLSNTRLSTGDSATYDQKSAPQMVAETANETARQVHEIDDVQRLNQRMDQHLKLSEQNARMLPAQPQLAAILRRQLAALLPEAQMITRRLADLRAKAQMLRMGHLAKIRRLAPQIPKLPPDAARLASAQLREAYQEARLEERIGRLDQAAVHAEKSIAEVILKVNQMLDAGRYDHAAKTLIHSEKLAGQVQRLMKQIDRDEKKVLALAVRATRPKSANSRAA